MGVTLWPEEDTALVPSDVFDRTQGTRPHVEYQTDPVGWMVEKLGIPEHTLRWSKNPGYENHKWDGTPDPLIAMIEAIRDWHDVGAEAGTGTQKSYTWALIIFWFLACWENSLVFTFAPVEKQLKLYIWKNLTELWPRFHRMFPDAELTDLCIRMRGGLDESWAAHGYAVGVKADEQVSTRASGMHGRDMLLVYEEMPGQPQQVIEAGKNTCTAPHNLRGGIGNPNYQLDTLHKFCTESGVVHIIISALDHPNVVTGNADIVPGAVSRKSITKRLNDYGETSPIYQSRVRGISPEQATNALIRLEWLKRSAARFKARQLLGQIPDEVTGKGVDAANSENGDEAAICNFYENACPNFGAFPCPDSNELGRTVALQIGGYQRITQTLDPNRVGVDAIGVGAGTVNELRRLGRVVQALYAGGKPMKMVEKTPDGKAHEWTGDVNMFLNLRAQMYWQAREDLRMDVIDVEENTELWEELVAPTYEDENKVVKLEPKDEISARLGRSPNKADAFVMANWVRKRAVKFVKPEPRENQSPGFDYERQKPRERETGEQWMDKMIRAGAGDPLYGRSRRPRGR